MRVEEGFQQAPYEFPEDIYEASTSLNSYLRRVLPEPARDRVESDLRRFSKRLGHGDIASVASLADGAEREPRLTQYDQFGRRIDRLDTSEGWRKLKGISAQEGMIAIAYERASAEYSRVHMFAKTYLWIGDERMIGCPLSMADGAARVIELYGTLEMKRDVYTRLISRDPAKAWTAGQFMTERPGGSDVSRTETTAVRAPGQGSSVQAGDAYILDGFKWFSSATDGEVALSLARTGPEGSGSAGLSLFLLPIKSESMSGGAPSANGVYVHRLKNKIGTKTLPTAELSISGARGYLVNSLGAGVKSIATVLNITRMHSSIHSVGAVGRALMVASRYALVRSVLDHGDRSYVLLKDLPLHNSFLAEIALLHHALVHLVLPVTLLLGLSETSKATEQEEWRLRLLTPVAKAYSGVRAANAVETCIEGLGGLGYMEEEGLGRLARDVLVERIWEGTSSVLSLDVARVILKSKYRAIQSYLEWANSVLFPAPFHSALPLIRESMRLIQSSGALLANGSPSDPRLPRALLDLFGHTTAALSMVEQAIWASRTPGEDGDLEWELVKRWSEGGKTERDAVQRLLATTEAQRARELAFDSVLLYGKAKL